MRYDVLDYVRGVLAGLVAGVAGGLVFAAGTATLNLFFSGISWDLQSVGALYFFIIFSFSQGLIIGPVLGLIYAITEKRFLKKRSLEIKGLVFGTITWILSVVTNLGALAFGISSYAAMIAFGLLGDLVLGYVLGTLYRRFGPQIVTPPPAHSEAKQRAEQL